MKNSILSANSSLFQRFFAIGYFCLTKKGVKWLGSRRLLANLGAFSGFSRVGAAPGLFFYKLFSKKEIDLPKRTPIVGMSSEECKQKALDSGMDDFHQKPLLKEKIVEVLRVFA